MTMPRIRITRNTVVGGKWVRAGEVVDASPADAALLIRLGKAEPVSPPSVPPASGGEGVERAMAEPDEQAVAPPQRGKRTRRKKRA